LIEVRGKMESQPFGKVSCTSSQAREAMIWHGSGEGEGAEAAP
jgi:hypothetical protein